METSETRADSRSTRIKRFHDLAKSKLLPWEYFVVPINGKNRELEYKFINLQDSRIV